MEQTLTTLIFGLLALSLVVLSLIVVVSRSVFRSAVALTAALSVVAGIFALLGADFVAAGQLLIYVGGIMIIMLFVIMMSQKAADRMDAQTNDQWVWGGLFALAVACGLLMQFRALYRGILFAPATSPTSAAIGRMLLGDMVVPFEAVSLVLLAALVGAVYFSQEKKRS